MIRREAERGELVLPRTFFGIGWCRVGVTADEEIAGEIVILLVFCLG